MKIQFADSEDPRGYRTWEEVEAEWAATRKLEESRRTGTWSLLWKTFYLLRECYYAVFYRFSPKYELKRIYWFFQRGWRGWSDKDTWHFQGYLSGVIRDGVAHLRKFKNGYPAGMDENEWNGILEEMVWAFDMADKIANGDVHTYVPEWGEEENLRLEKALKDNAKDHGYEMDPYMTKAECERMEKGLQLFVKHIWSLWD